MMHILQTADDVSVVMAMMPEDARDADSDNRAAARQRQDGRFEVVCPAYDDVLARLVADLPAVRLAAKRGEAQSAVNARRDTIIAAGYQHNFGGSAGIRTLDQRTEQDAINWLGLKGIADAMIADGRGSDLLEIRDAANETFEASATTISGAMIAMGAWRSTVMAHSWELKDRIEAAADEAALGEIDIEAGWPS